MRQQAWATIDGTARRALEVAKRQLRAPVEAGRIVRRVNEAAAGATRLIDREVERFISATLEPRGFAMLSEESGLTIAPGSRYFAIVDPIDGTDMALRGLKYYAVSIAAGTLERGAVYLRNVEYGVVMSPLGMYSAVKGAGAYFSGRRIRTSPTNIIEEAILRIPQKTASGAKLKRAKSYLYLGCSSLEICMVAHGLIDAYCESKRRKIYDYAAALLIASEAGAVGSTLGGAQLSRRALGRLSRSTLAIAANEELWSAITDEG